MQHQVVKLSCENVFGVKNHHALLLFGLSNLEFRRFENNFPIYSGQARLPLRPSIDLIKHGSFTGLVLLLWILEFLD